MAKQASQQQTSRRKDGQSGGRTYVDRSTSFAQQFQAKQVEQAKALSVEKRRGCEDEELQEEIESSSQAEVEKEQVEAAPARSEPPPESPFLRLHSQVNLQPPASAGYSSKDPGVLHSSSAMPSSADLLACMDAAGSSVGFPSKQVEGALQSCLTSAEGQVTRLLQQAMDTVQSQVLRALRQAASDIIQHLGKEAAHRVVVAERRAALLELELSSVKQQALSMLLRLKADSDSQALDADKKYLLERRRGQDAEAKLAIAQDNLKRLKVELKKKGDIIDMMQKLVQPMNEDNFQIPCRSMELTGQLESCIRGNSNKRLRKSPVCSVDGTSFVMCGTSRHNEEVNCAENQLHMDANVHAVNGPAEKKDSSSGKTPAVEEYLLGLQTQDCLCNGTFQNCHCFPNIPKEDPVIKNTDEGKEDLLFTDQAELSEQLEGFHKAESAHANVEQDAKSVENMDDIQHLLHSESIDEKVNPLLTNLKKIIDVDKVNPGSSAAVKGFYVRRKVKDNVKVQEKKEQSLPDERHCLNSISEHDLKAEVLIRSSNETTSQFKSDLSEGELQNFSSKRDPQVLLDATDSSSLLGQAVQLATECHGDMASDLLEEISSNKYSKAVHLGSNRIRSEVATEIFEFARPDYEVATSLAELASSGLEVRSQKMESLLHIGSKEGIFLKPGKTGLRMKRKGISFERQMKMQSEGRVSKKPRPDKLLSKLTDSRADRVFRRNRGVNYGKLKDSLSLESSRDNRRLLQGARQLLCLAEKKWR